MKSLSPRIAPLSRSGSFNACAVSPACDKEVNAARKIETECIDVCGVVVMVWAFLRLRGEAQPAQLRQGFGEDGERARGALGIDRPPRLGAEARAHGLDGGKLLEHGGFEAVGGGVARHHPTPRVPAQAGSHG